MTPQEEIGHLKLSTDKATISIMAGGFKDVKFKLTSGISGRHNQGGQSQQRFLRKREQAIKQFFKRVRYHMNQLKVSQWKIEGDKNMVKKFSS